MKTNFRPRNRDGVTYRKRIGTVFAVVIVLGLFFSFADSLIIRIVSPLWSGEGALARGMENISGYFRTKNALIEENQNLRTRVASQDLALVQSRTNTSSSEEILSHLGRVASSSGIAASVLVHPPETPYDILIIDAGSSEGVTVGQKVLLPEGPEIGKVVETFSHQSRVHLFSSSGEQTAAILERNMTPVTLIGQGGGSFEIELPRDVAVEVGDKIISPDIRSALIGVVGGVDAAPTDSFKKVLVGSVENMYSLRFVLISS
ncbi:MAG: Rod shape-determining protein MreC [Parcubacteria group bacterium]|nr:Rod shape-determining protein MreC [Parcubacteria group bacterium]